MRNPPHVSPKLGWVIGFAMLASAAPVTCQCTNPWPAVTGSAGVEGYVHDTLVYDPDGPGPIGERVLVSGGFQAAGNTQAKNLAIYDPATRTWAPFGPGPYPINLNLAKSSNGDTYVAGQFSNIAGVSADNVARFDGSNWSGLGAGVDGLVREIELLPNDELVVTGSFDTAGGVATENIAKWDGSNWSSLGSTSLGTASFGAVVALPNGDLCAAVHVTSSAPWFRGVMCFDGTSWSQLGNDFGSRPMALMVLPSGDLVAGGGTVPGGAVQQSVARWTGSSWVVLSTPPLQLVNEFALLPNGTLVASGRRSGSSTRRVATWDGFVWTTLGDTSSAINSLSLLASGDLLAGGSMTSIGGTAVNGLARWNGAAWSAASTGLVGSMRWLATRPDGSLFTATDFGGPDDSLVRRWNGATWLPMGGGFLSVNGSNRRLTGLYALPSGDLIVGGITTGATPPMPILQSWTGSTWSTFATSLYGQVEAVIELANGDLVVGGRFTELSGTPLNNIGRYDGSNWWPIGLGLPNGTWAGVTALKSLAGGDMLAVVQSRVFRWNGTAWAQIGLATGGTVRALVTDADDYPIIAGYFPSGKVLRWNGITWTPLGNGPACEVQSMTVLPNGDLVVGPLIGNNGPARSVERWDGNSWTAIGGTLDKTVYATTVGISGDLLLSGGFVMANGEVRCRFARISTSCPAAVQSQPSGCSFLPSPALAPNVLPWLGGTCRSTVANLPSDSLVVVVSGLTQLSTPLSTLLPQGFMGCRLLVTPDVLVMEAPNNAGIVITEFDVPNVTGLLGTTFHQQAITVALDSVGSVTQVKSSNALSYQIGTF